MEYAAPFFIKPIAKAIANKIDHNFTDGELTTHFGWIETALEGKTYFVGDAFSAADIQMSYPIKRAARAETKSPDRSNTRAFRTGRVEVAFKALSTKVANPQDAHTQVEAAERRDTSSLREAG